MKFEFEISNTPRASWDNEILAYESNEICQTSMYGEFIQNAGMSPAYISIYKDGGLIGNCLAEISKQKIAKWFFGPLLKAEVSNLQEEIISELFAFLKKNSIIAIENTKTQKYFTSQTSFYEDSRIYSKIGESPFVNIQMDMQSLINSFDRSVRKNINKCESNGVEITISDKNELVEPYIELLSQFRSERNFSMPPLFPNNETMRIFNTTFTSMRIAIAKHEGQILAGMGFVTCGNTMTEIAMATSEFYKIKNFPVNDYLKVKAIEFFKEFGIKIYDLTGGERNHVNHQKRGIVDFKKKFANGYATYGMIDRKVLSPLWYPSAILRKFNYLVSN